MLYGGMSGKTFGEMFGAALVSPILWISIFVFGTFTVIGGSMVFSSNVALVLATLLTLVISSYVIYKREMERLRNDDWYYENVICHEENEDS